MSSTLVRMSSELNCASVFCSPWFTINCELDSYVGVKIKKLTTAAISAAPRTHEIISKRRFFITSNISLREIVSSMIVSPSFSVYLAFDCIDYNARFFYYIRHYQQKL